MNLRITKDQSLLSIRMSVLLLLLGIVISYPIHFDWSIVSNTLTPITEAWWKVAAIFVCLGMISFLLKSRYIVIAEYIGAFACFFMLTPLISLLSGLPDDLGWKSAFFVVGGMFLLSALSGLLSVSILNARFMKHNNGV